MSHKVTWQSLLTTALVGTDRQSFDAAASHGALGESLSRLSTAAQKPSTLLLPLPSINEPDRCHPAICSPPLTPALQKRFQPVPTAPKPF